MLDSTASPDPNDDDLSAHTPERYQYDVCLEIGVKEEGKTIPVVAIFRDLVRHLRKTIEETASLVILTATDRMYFDDKDLESDEFKRAFHVDEVTGKNSKVLLGFKMHTTMKLSEIKRRLLHTYLIPRNLFLREHTGGFTHGVKTYMYGFLKEDHPDHPDVQVLNQCFA